jgi:hypothetical protein
MARPVFDQTASPKSVSRETLGQKTARWIDDPVASVVAGIAFPTAAVGFVVGGIYSLALIY